MEKEKEFDDFIKSIVVKKAPSDFTNKTIEKISLGIEKNASYRPILPKFVWIVLISLFAGIFLYLIPQFKSTEIDLSWFYNAIKSASFYLIYLLPLLGLLLIDSIVRLNKVNHFLK